MNLKYKTKCLFILDYYIFLDLFALEIFFCSIIKNLKRLFGKPNNILIEERMKSMLENN